MFAKLRTASNCHSDDELDEIDFDEIDINNELVLRLIEPPCLRQAHDWLTCGGDEFCTHCGILKIKHPYTMIIRYWDATDYTLSLVLVNRLCAMLLVVEDYESAIDMIEQTLGFDHRAWDEAPHTRPEVVFKCFADFRYMMSFQFYCDDQLLECRVFDFVICEAIEHLPLIFGTP